MPFPYSKTTWATGQTITATLLNQIEDQLEDLSIGLEVEFLLIAGGGAPEFAATTYSSGGGGAGGYISKINGELTGGGANSTGSIRLERNQTYTVTIGAGGSNATGTNGSDSVFSQWIAKGGAGDAGTTAICGSGYGGLSTTSYISGSAGLSGQGSNGGNTTSGSGKGAGGGGAGGAGQNAGATGGNGGSGIASSISGSSVSRGGGGGGGINSGTAGTATAGGGNGGSAASGGSGTANTGGGGGGAGGGASRASGNGGSGVFIVRYLGSQAAIGGTITSSGGYTIHTFTGSGTFYVY